MKHKDSLHEKEFYDKDNDHHELLAYPGTRKSQINLKQVR